jgi:hypothetical protein
MGRPKGSKNRSTIAAELKSNKGGLTKSAKQATAKLAAKRAAPAKYTPPPATVAGEKNDLALATYIIQNPDLSGLTERDLTRSVALGNAIVEVVAGEARRRLASFQALSALATPQGTVEGIGGDQRPVLPLGIERLDHKNDPRISFGSSKKANGAVPAAAEAAEAETPPAA